MNIDFLAEPGAPVTTLDLKPAGVWYVCYYGDWPDMPMLMVNKSFYRPQDAAHYLSTISPTRSPFIVERLSNK